MKKTKLKFGKKNLLPERIDPRDEKVRISIIMEGDLLDALRAKAAKAGTPYQTFMKEVLRRAVIGEETPAAGLGRDLVLKMFHELEEKMEAKFGHVEHEIEDLKKQA